MVWYNSAYDIVIKLKFYCNELTLLTKPVGTKMANKSQF